MLALELFDYEVGQIVNLLRWLWPRSIRSKALSLYKEGIYRAEKHDASGALAAYTSAIEAADAPEDIRAMALYNRALLLAASGNTEQALTDLRRIIDLPNPQPDVKIAARRRVDRLQHRLAAAALVKRPAT